MELWATDIGNAYLESFAVAAASPPSAEQVSAWVTHRLEVMTSYGIYMMLLFVAVPYACLLRGVFFKQSYNLAELLVFAIFTTSHGMLLTSLLAPVTVQFGMSFYTWSVLTVFIGIAAFAGWQFFKLKRAVAVVPMLFLGAYFFNALAINYVDAGLTAIGL